MLFLSHFLNHNTPLYGGKKYNFLQTTHFHWEGDNSNSKILNFPNHSGTHRLPYILVIMVKNSKTIRPIFGFSKILVL